MTDLHRACMTPDLRNLVYMCLSFLGYMYWYFDIICIYVSISIEDIYCFGVEVLLPSCDISFSYF